MRYRITFDRTGEWFEVDGKTRDECYRIAETERERRKWSELEVWPERVDESVEELE